MTSVIFLGTSAAFPSVSRGFSCIGILDGDQTMLFDCGDGAVRNILRYGLDVTKISSVLVTHNHSDHLSGLTQLIETMSIRQRTAPIDIFGPSGLKEYFETIQRITSVAFNRVFSVNLHEATPGQRFPISNSRVSTFEMDHTLPCIGYRLEKSGKVISFTGDTQPCKALQALSKESDLLIHEATYLQKDTEKARVVKHSTAREAAETALLANSRKLILTHVNESCEKPEEMIAEAADVFRNVLVATDGLKIEL